MGESKYRTKVDFARAWHSHLLHDGGEARDRIYYKVLDRIDCPLDSIDLPDGDRFWSQLRVGKIPEAYDKLEAAVRSRTLECDRGDLLIVLYFDETHSFTQGRKYTTRTNAPPNSLDSVQKESPNSGGDVHPTPYAAMRSAIACLYQVSCFTLFIWTHMPPSTLDPLEEPSGVRVTQAPFTETPFDCHPTFPVTPSDYTLAETARVGFLVKFGRPL